MEALAIVAVVVVVIVVLLFVGRSSSPATKPGSSRDLIDASALSNRAQQEYFSKTATEFHRALLVVLGAYFWKFEGKDPEKAFRMAYAVIYMREAGSTESRIEANEICKLAHEWSLKMGDQAIAWGIECGEIAQGRKSPWAD